MHSTFKLLLVVILAMSAISVSGQTERKSAAEAAAGRETAAYAEVALKRAEVEAELEALLVDYTDEFLKVKELKFAFTRLQAESARLSSLNAADRIRATTALGKLIVRKTELEVDLWKLQQTYADNHPEVRRAKRRVEIFEKSIKEILG